MSDFIDREVLLYSLNKLAPLCREPNVFIANQGCNCWIGISESIEIVKSMKGKNGAGAGVLRVFCK